MRREREREREPVNGMKSRNLCMHIDPAVVGAEPSEREVGLLGQRREGGEEEVGIPRLGAARRPLPLLGRVWWMEGSGRRLRTQRERRTEKAKEEGNVSQRERERERERERSERRRRGRPSSARTT